MGWLPLSFLDLVTNAFLFGFIGRNDYRNSGGRGGHASGVPRPYGGHGRGRGGSYNSNKINSSGSERQESGYDAAPRWDSGAKDGNDGWGNFPGAKVQNSPGRESFPGGWGTGVGSGNGGNSWGGGGATNNDGWGNNGSSGAGGGWGGGTKANDVGADNGGSSGWQAADPKRSSSSQLQAGNGNGGWSGKQW